MKADIVNLQLSQAIFEIASKLLILKWELDQDPEVKSFTEYFKD